MIDLIHPVYGEEEQQAMSDYLKSGRWGTEGEKTAKFEQKLGEYLGYKYVHCTTSGTMALILALIALNVKPGEEIQCPTLTMIATPNALLMTRTKPNFTDIEVSMDKSISVNFNGKYHKGDYINDSCQAFGVKSDARITCYSFSPHKIISTGQGGALATNEESLSRKIRMLKDFGRLQGGGDWHDHFGINGKFTDFQAVIGLEQLKRVANNIKRKMEIYYFYKKNLFEKDIIEFDEYKGCEYPWLVCIYVPKGIRQKLHEFLKSKDIQTRKMYPLCTDQIVYKQDGFYPDSRRISNTGLFLPSSVDITDSQLEQVCDAIKGFFK